MAVRTKLVGIKNRRNVDARAAQPSVQASNGRKTLPRDEAALLRRQKTLGTAAMVGWCVTSAGTGPAHALLTWRPLAGLGRISYGVYLWHLPFALVFAQGRPPWAAALLTLSTSLCLATVSWLLVERPALRGGVRRARPAQPVDAPVPTQRYAAR